MSSLFLGERELKPESLDGPQPVRVDVDHRFARTSVLRFQTYVYNAFRKSAAPDVWIEAQVMRGNQTVMVVAPNRIPPEVSTDLSRLPYWSEIALSRLPAGFYTLQVTANDKAGGSSASQRIGFSVE
jgi:hypothetical protein